jgi:hypothetical protein
MQCDKSLRLVILIMLLYIWLCFSTELLLIHFCDSIASNILLYTNEIFTEQRDIHISMMSNTHVYIRLSQ